MMALETDGERQNYQISVPKFGVKNGKDLVVNLSSIQQLYMGLWTDYLVEDAPIFKLTK